MAVEFYIVNEATALANQGRRENEKGLRFVQDKYGRYVIGVEVAPLWPDINWGAFEIVELGVSDFPEPAEDE